MTATDGRRIYAIGDIHGCIDELDRVVGEVRNDLSTRPHADPLLVFLGDYTDRGPDSRGVIETLISLEAEPLPTVFLMGNHDERFLGYLDDPAAMTTSKYHWLQAAIGGGQTLASYGIYGADAAQPAAGHEAFRAAVPQAHVDFLRRLQLSRIVGNYLFVHAGIRPGVALADQEQADLIWIRDEFLHHTEPHEHIVVHGHTPVHRVENHGNRIAVDTGAVFGRHLSCVVLEDGTQHELDGSSLLPI